MNYSKISVRYAKALFILAKEKEVLEDIKNDLELIITVLQENPDLNNFLQSPVIRPSKKKETLLATFRNSIHEISTSFLKLVIENKREEHISDISRVFISKYKEEKNIKTAILTTSTELSPDLEEKIKNLITDKYQSNIELTKTVNPGILGGFLIQVEDELIDASVSTKLKKIQDDLIKERI